MLTVLAQESTALTDQLKPLITSFSGAVTAGDIAGLIGQCVVFAIPFFLIVMGARKLIGAATSAIEGGSIHV